MVRLLPRSFASCSAAFATSQREVPPQMVMVPLLRHGTSGLRNLGYDGAAAPLAAEVQVMLRYAWPAEEGLAELYAMLEANPLTGPTEEGPGSADTGWASACASARS